MFRFLKDSAQYILLAMVYLRYVLGISTYAQLKGSFNTWLRANGGVIPDATLGWVMSAMRELDAEIEVRTSTDSVTNLITAQLTTPRGANEDRELIDMVVKALQLPFNRRMVGDRLKALQKAILTPNELAALKEELDRAEMTCSSCAQALRSGELVTFQAGGERVSLMCYRCAHPSWVACSACHGEVAEITRKFYVGQSTKCAKHAPAKPIVAATGLDIETDMARLQEIVGWQTRATATFTPAPRRGIRVPEPALFDVVEERAVPNDILFTTAGLNEIDPPIAEDAEDEF